MHCPRCGQQQISEDTRFCSRCGLPLNIIAEVVFHGGFLPQLADAEKGKSWLNRKNGVVFALLWLIFFLPICTIIIGGIFDNDALGAVSAVLGIFGSLMIFIASLVFLKSSKPTHFSQIQKDLANTRAQGFYGANQNALPPAMETYIPPAGSWRAPNTEELGQPGSVTQKTTRMLRRDE